MVVESAGPRSEKLWREKREFYSGCNPRRYGGANEYVKPAGTRTKAEEPEDIGVVSNRLFKGVYERYIAGVL